jgi:hypothetical protein
MNNCFFLSFLCLLYRRPIWAVQRLLRILRETFVGIVGDEG